MVGVCKLNLLLQWFEFKGPQLIGEANMLNK
jgi:hypothetical protein